MHEYNFSLDERITLNFLYTKNKKNSSRYTFFDRKKVIKIPGNKAEYFKLDYSSVSDALLSELTKQHDRQRYYPSYLLDDRDNVLSNLKFLIEIEYNDPTDNEMKKLISPRLKLYSYKPKQLFPGQKN